jgi:hypothetical protein
MSDPEQPINPEAQQPIAGNPEPLAANQEAEGVTTPDGDGDALKGQIPWHLRKPTAEAPYGWTKDGKVKVSNGGRPSKKARAGKLGGSMRSAKVEAEKVVGALLEQASKKLVNPVSSLSLSPDAQAWAQVKKMRPETKAAVLASVVGPDVDKFREQFANDLLVAGHEMLEALRADIDRMKPGERAFALSVLVDKGESLRSKLSSSANTAQVNTQINIFGGVDGEEARRKIMEELYPKPIDVTPKQP